MKHLLAVVCVAILSAGCSPLMYPGYYRPIPRVAFGKSRVEPPLPVGRWDNVMRLPRTSTIDVLTDDGAAYVGPIVSADGRNVRLVVDGVEVQIDRASIVRVDLVSLPGSSAGAVVKRTARGALLGAGASTLIGAVVGGELWPPPGALVRAGVAVGGVAGGEAALTARRPRMIYLKGGRVP